MSAPRTSTPTLIAAMRALARDIESPDGIANAAILEAAERLEQLSRLLGVASERLRFADWTKDFRDEVREAIK